MSFIKYPLPESVLQATEQRIQWVMDNFSRICVSFSGGKDSTVMLHLTAQAARLQGKKICVLFIDWEAQFSCTIAHCEKLRALYADVIETFYWVALPLTTQNALTQYKPQWQCWESGTEWVRQPPPWARAPSSIGSSMAPEGMRSRMPSQQATAVSSSVKGKFRVNDGNQTIS